MSRLRGSLASFIFQIVGNLKRMFQCIYWKKTCISWLTQFRLFSSRVNWTLGCSCGISIWTSTQRFGYISFCFHYKFTNFFLKILPTSECQNARIFPGERNSNLLQYFCLENPKDRGTCWAIVHRVTKSWIQLSDYTTRILSIYRRLQNISLGFGAASHNQKKKTHKFLQGNIYLYINWVYRVNMSLPIGQDQFCYLMNYKK